MIPLHQQLLENIMAGYEQHDSLRAKMTAAFDQISAQSEREVVELIEGMRKIKEHEDCPFIDCCYKDTEIFSYNQALTDILASLNTKL